MPSKTHALRTFLCTILALSILISPLFTPFCSAQQDEKTKLYFKKGLNFDSLGTYPLLSEIPPTDNNASYYPPRLIDISLKEGVSFDNETILQWFISWAFVLFENLDAEEFQELTGFPIEYLELFDQFSLLFPHPLRIIQSYKYTGNETIKLSGNIDYELFFRTKPASQLHKNDKVKLTVYTYSEGSILPVEVKNTTISLTPGYFQKTIQQSVTLTNISKTINPNQSILFSVELIPGEKTIPTLLKRENPLLKNVTQFVVKAIRSIANITDISSINELFALLDELEELMEEEGFEISITKEDIAEVVEAIISSSFVYDSNDYRSSVTVPLRTTDSGEDNSVTYYLHPNNVLKASRPNTAVQQSVDLVSSNGVWTGPELNRNKIISDASAIVYINHKDGQRLNDQMVVTAELRYGNTTLDTDSVTLERTNLFSTSLKPYRFTFDDLGAGQELTYGNEIGLRLSLSEPAAADNFLRSTEIFYGASDFLSLLSFTLSETDHIQTSTARNPSNGKIIVGETVEYALDITSELQDSVSVSVQADTFSSDEQEFWDVSITPESFSIGENSNKSVTVSLTSLGTTLDAYDEDPLEITLEIIGKTGYDTVQLSAEVSEDAVTYDTIITAPKDKEVVHGTNATFTFVIENNNTGLWKDSFIFSATADENISVSVSPNTFDNLEVGNNTNVSVKVSIPEKTEIDEATITFKVRSKRSGIEQDVSVNITIIGANIFENIYDYFEGISESLGLTEVFGEYGPIVLVSIIFIVVFFILILMAFILTNKYVEIICLDRVKEISPDNTATYEVTLKNTTNKVRTYHISSDLAQKSNSWNIEFSQNQISIPAKNQQTITATVTASDQVNPGDWNEFELIVTTEGKSKQEKIPLFCSLSDGTVSLEIKDVFHWPKSFSKDDKVSTSLRLLNNGSVQAKNVSVKLFINNKEKNKVEELIIPAGGHADITLPWIAEKGKNDLRIMVS